MTARSARRADGPAHPLLLRRAGAAGAVALALLLAGCSGSVQVGSPDTSSATEGSPSPTGELLDTAKAAEVISDTISSSVGAEVPVEITCPEDVVMVQAGTFACSGTVDGQPITIDVVQKDGAGNVSYESQQSLIALRKAESGIAADANKRQGTTGAKVTCPGPGGAGWVVALPGSTFECTFTSTKSAGTVVVTVKDNKGTISWVYQT